MYKCFYVYIAVIITEKNIKNIVCCVFPITEQVILIMKIL